MGREHGDPTVTDPDKYVVVFENQRVRVPEYRLLQERDAAARESRVRGVTAGRSTVTAL